MSVFLEFLLPILPGIAFIYVMVPLRISPGAVGDVLIKTCLGLGAGVAGGSIVQVLLLSIGCASRGIIAIVEVLLLAAAVFVLLRRHRTALKSAEKEAVLPPVSRLPARPWLCGMLGAAFLAGFWKSITAFHAITLSRPHGEWDAWAVWNMRARFLHSEHWRDAFSPELRWAHIDYPLLLPGWIAHGWTLLGNETIAFPAVTAAAFTFGTVILLAVSVGILRSVSHGLLAGVFLLGCTNFVGIGTIQYADIPFAFYFLATLIILAFQDQYAEQQPRLLVLAGIFGGMAAWTKNEGQAMLFAVFVSFFVLRAMQQGVRHALPGLRYLATGALPFLMLIGIMRLWLTGGGNWLQHESAIPLKDRVLDWERYKIVAKAMWHQSKGFAGFSGEIARYALVFYALVVGIRIERQKLFPWLGILVLGIVMSAVFIVYVITPFALQWHIDTSITRLVCQWLPSGLFVFFLSLNTPEELQRSEMYTAGDALPAAT